MMRWRVVLMMCALAAPVAAAGCGPRVAVYNGGLVHGRALAPQGADLAPSEATVAFSTDYAAAEDNRGYIGPTNRVRADVPEPEYAPIVVSSSYAPNRFRTSAPTSVTSAREVPETRADSRSGGLLTAAPEATQAVGKPNTPIVTEAPSSLAGNVYAYASAIRQESGNVMAPAQSDAVHVAASPRGAQDMEERISPVQAALTRGAFAAATKSGADTYKTAEAARNMESAESVEARHDAAVARVQADLLAVKEAMSLARAVHVGASEGHLKAAAVHAPVVRAASAAPQGIYLPAAPQGMADSAAAGETSETRLPILAEAAQSALKYSMTRIPTNYSNAGAAAAYEGATAPTAQSDALAARQAYDSRGLPYAAQPKGVFSGETSAASNTYLTAHGLQASTWTVAPGAQSSASPPGVSVLKEYRVLDPAEVEKLLRSGFFATRPRSSHVIGYRIHVYNHGGATAANVKFTDRLDEKTALLPNSLWTTLDGPTAEYDADTRTVVVTVPRLLPLDYLMIEFYVELVEP